jgi:hypothetical protein
LALSVPLSRFTPRVGGGSAFFVRHFGVVEAFWEAITPFQHFAADAGDYEVWAAFVASCIFSVADSQTAWQCSDVGLEWNEFYDHPFSERWAQLMVAFSFVEFMPFHIFRLVIESVPNNSLMPTPVTPCRFAGRLALAWHSSVR